MTEPSKDLCKPKTFEFVFKTHAKDLRRFIYYKTRDIAAAEDIVQDAFVKIWEDCRNIRFETVKGLLYTIANNLFLNKVKHLKVVHKHQQHHGDETNHESPEYMLLQQEFQERLTKAVAGLPDIQREVFLMSRIDRKKYKEIAVILNISTKAVEKRMHNALRSLQEQLGKI
jgi:RNA polymerase sigma-70 factor (ECF subfamily)